jgi:transposase-like protein
MDSSECLSRSSYCVVCPVEMISHVVWLYFRFQLGLRMAEALLSAGGILVSHTTTRQWAFSSSSAKTV